jgi:ABC-type branched-subunit amino acid transport system ATPase component
LNLYNPRWSSEGKLAEHGTTAASIASDVMVLGVELAAKPDILLFLDEPTLGLDGNVAFSIV